MVVDVASAPRRCGCSYRLESLHVRAISNVVDVTNLVMLEFGHPMHAFDFDLVRGGEIVVRRAAEGEKLKTLDGVERTLVADDLVIADGGGPVALAGMMGGEGSEIRAETRRVLLECAYFTTRGVRRSSRRHALHTESSHRFERGVDPGDLPDVLAHSASLLTALAGGKAVSGTLVAGVPLAQPAPLRLRASRMNALLGMEVPFAEATTILERLGFAVTVQDGGAEAQVVPPTHRPDIAGEADLIEEVLRIRGVDSGPHRAPGHPAAAAARHRRDRGAGAARRRRGRPLRGGDVRLRLPARHRRARPAARAVVTLQNPLGEERSAMRNSLLPGLLDALRRARRRGVGDVRLFTVGARFVEPFTAAGLPDEVPSFAAVVAGHRRSVLEKPVEVDVYDAKGVAVAIVERVTGLRAAVAAQTLERRSTFLHPRGAGDVLVEGRVVGCFGPLHPDVADLLDLGGPCVVVDLDVRALGALGFRVPRFTPIPVLPPATRDIALVVHDDVSAGAVGDAIRAAGGEICESVALFDLFRGEAMPPDHRSLAFHVVYRDPRAATDPDAAKTLTDEEVDRKHAKVVEAVKEKFGAVLRG